MSELQPKDKAFLLLKDAFKRLIYDFIGLSPKPEFELGAWSLALLEVAQELREKQLDQQS